MEQRRKIVIPTSAEPIEEPHFDAEATLSARPVVPLKESPAVDFPEGAQPNASSISSITRRSPWLLVLLIAGAALAGAAGALAIDYLRRPQRTEATITTEPPSTTATVAQPVAKPTEEMKSLSEVNRAAQPPVVTNDDEKVAETTATAPPPTVNTSGKKPEPDAQPKASAATPKEEPSRKETKPEVVAKSPRPRDKSEDERADNERERRQQRREQRRARIVDEYKPEDLPVRSRRAKEGVTRIRDIFEGTRP